MRQAASRQARSGKTRGEGARLVSVGEATSSPWRKNDGRRNGKPGPPEGRTGTHDALRDKRSARPDAKRTERGRAFGVDPTPICHVCRKWTRTRK